MQTRAALCLVLALAATAGPAPASMNEYAVKAAFLYNFAKFVEWPDSAFAGHPDTHRFCFYGADPFGPSLATALAGKTVQGRNVVILHPALPAELQGCQLVFLGREAEARLPEAVRAVRGHPVLLVGEIEGFALRGGMINFFVQNDHVRFEINRSAASAAGLLVSSKLLDLAKIVGEEER
jgi:hypothetical protein